MKRTTIFVPDELSARLDEAADRMGRSRAELVREALATYLDAQQPPWPQSFGAFESEDDSVDSTNVKQWLRGRWAEAAGRGEPKVARPIRNDE